GAVCDDGLVIDLSAMTGIRVDPSAGTVQAQGGITIGQLDHETQAFGLAVPMGVVSATGIAGLTLGGGIGWLRRRWGLSCDNLLSADVVTAEGELVVAGEGGDSDLLWALQGGGGAVGVVTSFTLRAHRLLPTVFLAFVIHAGTDATEALAYYRDWADGAPDEISAMAILWHAPPLEEIPTAHHGEPIVVFLAMYAGDPAAGEESLADLRRHGRPIADLSAPMPYLQVQRFFDEDYPDGMRYYWTSRFLSGLPDTAIASLVALNEAAPTPASTIDLWQLGGAMGRVPADATAFGNRSAALLAGIEANWENPLDDQRCISWAREVHAELQAEAAGLYLNFPGLFEDDASLGERAFGSSAGRLAELRRRYDLTGRFRLHPGEAR
ncbi:MAG TPA: FAD-dependent oxidoreductase, partial [Euzebya sp.]|nr:FAD-dependent oxidoreductase [Euzebya sp.]